ncbi:conserved oligomeric Golgi complex subunit 1-like isoform X2 [Montipora capricornis]|uniref:conserved oligomeric Golgi complex subunit 1-like isoform X2 n=1 Tax=Montipora capricornis TaxID=246305 RepID=UPI0035F1CCA7
MAAPHSPKSPRTPRISPLSPRQSDSKSIHWDAEMDSDALFSNHTIEEIRAVEQKTRSDIERKKEDLRLMVGERYRDLIDAADTVTEMKMCSSQVTNFVHDIQKQCKELHLSHKCHGVGGTQSAVDVGITSQTKSGFYAIASQMKLLVDTPEKVWSALEKKQYLKAARLYLFSHHIVSILHIDTGDSSAPKLLSSFPILPKQWAAISHFKDSILQGSRALLKDASQTDEMLAESLCSILLLEESSPRQVFTEFLLARKAALQEIFHPCQHATSIKSQVCEVVQIIRSSLHQIHALFSCPDESDVTDPHLFTDNPALVFKTIADVVNKESSPNSDEEALEALFGPDFDLVTSARFLPKTVLGYRPQVRAFPSVIPKQNIHHNCTEWIEMCAKDVTTGVSSLLKYIGSLKGLASVRDAVWDLLKEAETTSFSSGHSLDWKTLCNRLLGRDLSIWDEFLRPLFLSRARAILKGLFDATVSSCKNMITKSQDDISDRHAVDHAVLWERDIVMYVWHESPNDVPRPVDSNLPHEQDSGLSLKARACTPAVQRLCKSVDDKLGALLEDSQYFTADGQRKKGPESSKKTSVTRISDVSFLTPSKKANCESDPFDRFGDSRQIQTYLQETCLSALNELLEYIDDIICTQRDKLSLNSECTISGKSQPFDTVCIDRVLFVGRLCHSLIAQCRHITLVVDGGNAADYKSRATTSNRTPKTSSSLRKKEEQDNFNNMAELTKSLRERYFSAYRLWRDWISVQFLSSLEAWLLLGGHSMPLLSMTNWEEIKIEEESEEGKKVESVIRVPAQVSSHVTSLLFSLCQELNRIGAHALDRKLLHELVTNLSRGVLSSHEKLIQERKSSLTQNQALQVTFDLKFLTAILAGRGEDDTSDFTTRREQVLDSLESCVDPFDLDVFTPYIAANLNRQLQRCGVLFGVLASLDKHSTHSFGVTQRPSSGSPDQHNIMPLAPNPPRFTLLPLSSHSTSGIGSQTADHVQKMGPSRSQEEEAKGFFTRTAFFNHQQFFNRDLSKRQGLVAS